MSDVGGRVPCAEEMRSTAVAFTVGVNIRDRVAHLTLSYRTTREILNRAMEVVNPKSDQITFDDLDDGTGNLDGYRSVLRGRSWRYTRRNTGQR
ncbi:hypothetical protein ACGH7X_29590 [Streptomyces sp. BBFR51]|uniref:hypothetical protein n=1 Tax=Streptomyces sp. BBFR51 TaxID=3372856 RepID=UPI0037DC7E06